MRVCGEGVCAGKGVSAERGNASSHGGGGMNWMVGAGLALDECASFVV